MYSIDLNNIVPHKDLTCLVAKASADECILWHRRLGHLNVKTMNKLVRHNLVRGLPTKSFDNDHTCTACLKGKQHKASCKSKLVNSVTKPLHTLHMDLFGPTSVSSISHKWYCLVVTDDFSRFTWTFFLRTKDETSDILKKFITEIENLKDYKVKIISGKEDVNTASIPTASTNVFPASVNIIAISIKTLKKEKERLESKLTGFKLTTKDLDNLIGSQRSDKIKEGLGYSAVPPPAQVYSPPKKDMSWTGLSEFADAIITDYTMPSPSVEREPKKLEQFEVPTVRPAIHRPYKPPMGLVRPNMNVAQPKRTSFHKLAHSYSKRPFQRTSAVSSQFRAPRFPTVTRKFPTVNRKFPTFNKKFPTGNTKFSTVDLGNKGTAGNSQNHIDDKDYWDSGCSRHMTGNISYLFDYEPFDGGYVSFCLGGCKITGKGTIKTEGRYSLDLRKSTSGGIQFLGGDKLVSWSSKKQDNYGFYFDKIPMYCDSKAAIAISCNPVQHSCTKHIDVRYHFIKEKVEKCIVELFFVGTEYQLADLFNKALPEERFKYLVRRLDMRCLTPEELEALANESA
nr:putative ribonuclease H-like domain-containing protein [Tanacetum cinerariifolium]